MADSDPTEVVFDVDEVNFRERVIDASRHRPVVVDFWAPWCQPCLVLGPVLERVVRSHEGRCLLAKVNVDQNRALAAALGVQGIPTVKVFRDGRVVGEFVGALPEAEVQRILARLVPSAADQAAQQASQLLQTGKTDEAEKRFREVLAQDQNNAPAAVGLASLLIDRGQYDEARQLASRVQPDQEEFPQAKAILDRLDFIEHCQKVGGREEVEKQFTSNPDNLDLKFDLASCLAAEGRYQDALETLLSIIEANKNFRDGAAKEAMVKIFGIVGQRSELADQYRQRLAQLLY